MWLVSTISRDGSEQLFNSERFYLAMVGGRSSNAP